MFLSRKCQKRTKCTERAESVKHGRELVGTYVRPICLPKPVGGIKPNIQFNSYSKNKIWITGYDVVESGKTFHLLKRGNNSKGKIAHFNETELANVLKVGQVNLITNKQCTSKLNNYLKRYFKLSKHIHVTKTQVCVNSERKNAVDTCQGDSGGPMSFSVSSDMIRKKNRRTTPSPKTEMYNKMERYQLEGITSWGITCGQKLPGVYTKVSQFMDFILEHSRFVQTVENEVLSKR